MKIKLLQTNDRPRERLINLGVEALSDVELLAVILGTGTKDMDVITLANYICNKYSIRGIKDLNYEELIKIPGIKIAKASSLIATFELVKRSLSYETNDISFDTSSEIFKYIYSDFFLESKEKIIVLYLNNKLNVLKKSSFNSYNPSLVNLPIRKIVEEALGINSTGIIIAHNHPSGDITPSEADKVVTLELANTLKTLNIMLIDHLIVFNDKYFSFSDNGMLADEIEYDYLGDLCEKVL